MSTAQEEPLPEPPPPPRLTSGELLAGAAQSPMRRLSNMEPTQVEELVLHWLHETQRDRYKRLMTVGGTGDQGRDVIAYIDDGPNADWDNFQCKRYAKALSPQDAVKELIKLIFYTHQGAYSVPRRYYFVAPKGVSEQTRKLLANVTKLRARIAKDWTNFGEQLCPLADVQAHLDTFQFPALDVVKGEEIILSLQGKQIYPIFFGGGLSKPRPEDMKPPATVADHELGYVECLVEAYDEDSSGAVGDLAAIEADETYGSHLRSSRREFYCAESLREFSKDVLVAEHKQYGDLQQQVHDGIDPVVRSEFKSGYARVLAVTAQAAAVQLDDHPLTPVLKVADRKGICHQLANDGTVRWKQ
ncbi:MAG: ABC-three component system protein [Solirubrobacteraceae bacterium]